MDPELLASARAKVASVLGDRVASKASDSFCLTFGLPPPPALGFEAVAEAARPRSIVLEFSRQPEISAEINRAVEELRKTKAWTSLRRALKKIEMAPVTTGVATELMETGRSEPEILPVQAARLLRYVKVTSLRDNFLKSAGAITDHIERGSQRTSHPQFEMASAPDRRPAAQVCWLNRTVRSIANPQVLAEVAADDSIARIDMGRRLTPDLGLSASTVGAPQFRKKFKHTGKGIIVAVIDSEVAMNHPALKGRVAHKENFTGEPWGNPHSHGTAVAGIIGSNDDQFPGMAPDATIYNYKVLSTDSTLSGDDFDGALAIQQAVEDGAHIANCSWGAGPAGDGTSREAIACNEAWALGLVLVKSAGNKGPGARTLTTPADADGVIAVGGTDREGREVQDYSSRGPAGTKNRPHLIAPGGIFGGIGITSCLVGGGFGDCGAGTSFAAPHVSGIIALLLERDPSATPETLRDILLNASAPLDGIGADTQGNGLVSLGRVS